MVTRRWETEVITSDSKYQGAAKFTRVRDALVKAARTGGLITYKQVAVIMGLPTTGNLMSRETGIVADKISRAEHNEGRPMLTAILVHSTDLKPGPGFYKLATHLGRPFKDTPDGRKKFWEEERGAVYTVWENRVE
jgi:hypothetical protein